MADYVSDGTVRSIIDEALIHEPSWPGESIVHRTGRAFRKLQTRRRKDEPLNINLAAAEHYMYARFLAGVSGDPATKMAPTLYGLKKRLFFALGIEHLMATTDQPVLPPNDSVERWGIAGANDGLADYSAATGRPADNFGGAAKSLITEATRYSR